jgi:glycosyltransferase involved in cell wall biosynthesis
MSKVYVVSCQSNSNVHAIKCINSVKNQSFKVEKHFYVDDVSHDNTREIIEEYLRDNPIDNIELILNDEKKFKTRNMELIIDSLDDDSIVCVLDGDDWLAYKNSIELMVDFYKKNPDLEFVYSNWMYSHNGQLGISKPIPSKDWDPYRDEWLTSHFQTFRAAAYKRIPRLNLVDAEGDYFKMATDQAYTLPMLECIKRKYGNFDRVKHFPAPMYVYQFNENESRKKGSEIAKWEAMTAYESARFIRQRGFLES